MTHEEQGEEDYGSVLTFDDVTELVSAQRTSAWADVARRIAHEIKNPLTPIQLSAERLRRKYGRMITEDVETFERCTDTIIRQVGDVTRMVDEFSAFARTPKPQMEDHDIRDVVRAAVLDRQMTTTEGIVMRRFEELKLVRSRSPLFALSWTVMHPIDESSPLRGADIDSLYQDQVEVIILLSGRDDTLSDIIYARHSYMPDEIMWNQQFVDVLEVTPSGRRLLDLHCFHETAPLLPD